MTKQCWEKWGKPPMEQTLLTFKLVDGSMTQLVGIDKDLKVKYSRLSYNVWFVVMDFGNQLDPYDVILGRPYMRHARLIHDQIMNISYYRKGGQ